MSKIDIFPYSTPIRGKIWGVPFGVVMLASAERRKVRLIIGNFRRIPTRVITVHELYRQTDRRTTYRDNTALRYASRGKNIDSLNVGMTLSTMLPFRYSFSIVVSIVFDFDRPMLYSESFMVD